MAALPSWFVYPVAALFGAVWASFLNVVIVRLPRGESIVFPASHCLACRASIRAYDNVPVLSYLWLRGRCRHCRAPYAPRYALVEALGGAAALAVTWRFGPTAVALGYYAFLWLLLGIAAIDLEHWIIPHELSWSGIVLGLAFSFINPRTAPASALLGAALAWAAFTLLSVLGEKLFKKEALGLGDRWLLAMEGAFLGAGALLPLVFLASVQGSLVGLLLIAMGRAQSGERPAPAAVVGAAEGAAAPAEGELGRSADADWVPPKNAIPFGPFLALAAVEWLFFGPALWRWYAARLFDAGG